MAENLTTHGAAQRTIEYKWDQTPDCDEFLRGLTRRDRGNVAEIDSLLSRISPVVEHAPRFVS